MGTFSANDFSVTVGGTDLSAWVRSVELNRSIEELDDSAMGDTAKSRIGGLQDAQVSIEFNDDYAASSVDVTIDSNFGSAATVVMKPTSGAVSATNPSYTGSFLVSQHPVGGTHGQLAVKSVTWPYAGGGTGITRATS